MPKSPPPSIQGLYVITDPKLSPGLKVIEDVEQALQGGARIVQYRDKVSSDMDKLANAKSLQALCQQYNALFIMNDDIELAHYAQADGVHLGKNDADLQTARQVLGEQAIIGVTCYNDLQRAQQMEKAGADYVAFGRFFPSQTKPDATPATLDTLHQARQTLHIPIVAIGGITAQNACAVMQAGADAIAVIHAVFGSNDPKFSSQLLNQTIKECAL